MSVVLLVCLSLCELGDFPGSVGTKSWDLQRAVQPEQNLNKRPATHQGVARRATWMLLLSMYKATTNLEHTNTVLDDNLPERATIISE